MSGEMRKVASASAWVDPMLDLFPGIALLLGGEAAVGQVPTPVRSPPTAHSLLSYLICLLHQSLLTKKERCGKDIVITNVTMIPEIQK